VFQKILFGKYVGRSDGDMRGNYRKAVGRSGVLGRRSVAQEVREPEYSVDEALLRKYVNKQFNWVQANPIYRG